MGIEDFVQKEAEPSSDEKNIPREKKKGYDDIPLSEVEEDEEESANNSKKKIKSKMSKSRTSQKKNKLPNKTESIIPSEATKPDEKNNSEEVKPEKVSTAGRTPLPAAGRQKAEKSPNSNVESSIPSPAVKVGARKGPSRRSANATRKKKKSKGCCTVN